MKMLHLHLQLLKQPTNIESQLVKLAYVNIAGMHCEASPPHVAGQKYIKFTKIYIYQITKLTKKTST